MNDVYSFLAANAGVIALLAATAAAVAAIAAVAAARSTRRQLAIQAERHHLDLRPQLTLSHAPDPASTNPIVRLTNAGPLALTSVEVTLEPPSDRTLPAATVVVTGEGRVSTTELGPLGVHESRPLCIYLEKDTPQTVTAVLVATAAGHPPWTTYGTVTIDAYDVLDSVR